MSPSLRAVSTSGNDWSDSSSLLGELYSNISSSSSSCCPCFLASPRFQSVRGWLLHPAEFLSSRGKLLGQQEIKGHHYRTGQGSERPDITEGSQWKRHLKQKSYQASIIKDHSRFANPRLSHFLWKCSYLIIVSICKFAMPFMNWILKIWTIFVSLLKVKCLRWQISVKTSN